MTLLVVEPNSVYAVRVFKQTGGKRWVNTYELQRVAPELPSNPASLWQDVATAFVEAERQLHLTTVQVERVVISTIEPDGIPYNPLTFVSFEVNLPGFKNTVSSLPPLPLSTCVLVKRRTAFGRAGNLLLRGCLVTTDGNPTPDGYVLSSTIRTAIQTSLNDLLTDISGLGFSIVLAKRSEDNTATVDVRPVTSFQVRERTTVKKLYNRYFDVP